MRIDKLPVILKAILLLATKLIAIRTSGKIEP
jgi:hypothetical protein